MLKISAEKRNVFGKALKSLRKAGKLPVVVYGAGKEAEHFLINEKDFLKVWKEAGETSVIEFDGGNGVKDVLVQDIDFDPVKDRPVHVDFLAVDKNKAIEVSVPLEFVGQSQAVKSGGTLVKVLHELKVKAIPRDIPHSVDVDISSLINFGDQILVKDLKLANGVEVMLGADEVVALVAQASVEPEETTTEPVDLSKIEVEKKGKKEEEVIPE